MLGSLVITLLLVFFTGLESHRSILDNALISLSILAGLFFIFLSFGLYYAVYVKDDLSGKFKLKWIKAKDWLPDGMGGAETATGCSEELGGVFAWIAITIVLVIAVFFLGTLLWAGFVIVVGAIYWVMIRMLKAIFTRSHTCHGKLWKSMAYACMYTTLYIGWIYGVILLAMELKK